MRTLWIKEYNVPATATVAVAAAMVTITSRRCRWPAGNCNFSMYLVYWSIENKMKLVECLGKGFLNAIAGSAAISEDRRPCKNGRLNDFALPLRWNDWWLHHTKVKVIVNYWLGSGIESIGLNIFPSSYVRGHNSIPNSIDSFVIILYLFYDKIDVAVSRGGLFSYIQIIIWS